MIRNPKILGPALVAVCALAAMTASVAQAAGSPDFSMTPIRYIKASKDEGKQIFTSQGGVKVRCEEVGGEGALSEENERSNELTFDSFEYSGNCLASGVFPATVDTSGCHLTFTVEETVTATESKGSVKLQCTGEPHSVTITIYKAGAETVEGKHLDADRRCIIHIPDEQTFSGVTYKNIETEDGQMHVTFNTNVQKQIHSTDTSVSGGIPGCEKSEQPTTEDSFEGKFIASAEDGSGQATNLTIEDTP